MGGWEEWVGEMEWVGGREEGSEWVGGRSWWVRWRSGWEVGKEGEMMLGGGTDLNRCSCNTNVDSIWTEDIC